MEALAQLEKERGNSEYLSENPKSSRLPGQKSAAPTGGRARTASKEMCTFLILNISSLQIIPVNMIAYRQQYGSVSPTAVVGPAILATAMSTLVAVVFCKVMDAKRRA